MSVRTIAATIFFCSAILAWGVPRTYGAHKRSRGATLRRGVWDGDGAAESRGCFRHTRRLANASGDPGAGQPHKPLADDDCWGCQDDSSVSTASPTDDGTDSSASATRNALQCGTDRLATTARTTGQDVPEGAPGAGRGCDHGDACRALHGHGRECADCSAAGEISAAAGVSIDQLTPLNQFVAHFDPFAGEAHTVLQLDDASGARIELPFADGWLLENGSWQSVNC